MFPTDLKIFDHAIIFTQYGMLARITINYDRRKEKRFVANIYKKPFKIQILDDSKLILFKLDFYSEFFFQTNL